MCECPYKYRVVCACVCVCVCVCVHPAGGPAHVEYSLTVWGFVDQCVQKQNHLSTSELLSQLNVYNIRLQALIVATTLPKVQCFSFKCSS